MREAVTRLALIGAHESTLHTRLINGVQDAVTEVYDAGAAAFALALVVCGVIVFLVASIWQGARVDVRPDRVGWTLTGIRIAGLLVAFGGLGYQVKIGGRATLADESVLNWLADHRSPWLTGPAIAITDAGGPVGTTIVAVLLGAVLSRRARSFMPAIVLIGTVGAAALASTVTKSVVGRQRPPVVSQVLLEADHSFPSGHATGAMALFGMAALMLGYGLPRAQQWALFLLAGLLTVVVAVTRLYLGEHWLTDVIGGVILGGASVVAGSAIYAALMTRTHNPLTDTATDTDTATRPSGRRDDTAMGTAA